MLICDEILFYRIKLVKNYSWCNKLTGNVVLDGPPLRFSGKSSWLQIQRFGFDSRRYQISWEVVGLERGPLSLVSTIQELLGWKSSGPGVESREYGRRERWPRGTFYRQKLTLTWSTNGGRSVVIVRSRTQATEFCGYFYTCSVRSVLVEACTVIMWSEFRALWCAVYCFIYFGYCNKKKLTLEVPGTKNCWVYYVITVSSYATRHFAPRGVPQVETKCGLPAFPHR
jgi:hypothetical protein